MEAFSAAEHEIGRKNPSKSQLSKILRKQKRCQVIVSKDIRIDASNEPTQFLGICNAGMSTGLQDVKLLEEVLQYGRINEVIMIPGKSYCFLECATKEDAVKIVEALNGQVKLGQNDTVLYLSYFLSIPRVMKNNMEMYEEITVPGLIILKEFVNENEEKLLLESFKNNSNDDTSENALKHRFVQHFGYEFLYGSNQVDPNAPLEKKIPSECNILWPRLKERIPNLGWYEPEQLTVNHYLPGQGIPSHVDTHSAFLDPILSLSLESDIVMEFKKSNIEGKITKRCVPLPRRSLLVMSGESRYDWKHGITPRHMDIVRSSSNGLTTYKRGKRISLTFRKLRNGECDCKYPNLCDTAAKLKLNNESKDIEENIQLSEEIAAKLERTGVHEVYNKIANHFSETRHKPWPKVAEFINSFEHGSILLDVGCGNGKYLGMTSSIMQIGCDRSEGLLKICKSRGFNVFQCDCLEIPFRDNSISGCISIAVIHHLATKERRLKAINEMARILQRDGKTLIYVWAKNQELNSQKSSYLRQNKALNKNKTTEEDLRKNTDYQSIEKPCTEVDLPIHTNRTKFENQDIFVPWKLKTTPESELANNNETFLRYYHVFEENELENLCREIKSIEVISSYYDQGNWCVIFKKL